MPIARPACTLSALINKNKIALNKASSKAVAVLRLPVNPTAPETDRQPEMNHLFGGGVRYRWPFTPQPGLEGELWLSIYEQESIIALGGQLKATGGAAVKVEDIKPCNIEISRPSHQA